MLLSKHLFSHEDPHQLRNDVSPREVRELRDGGEGAGRDEGIITHEMIFIEQVLRQGRTNKVVRDGARLRGFGADMEKKKCFFG